MLPKQAKPMHPPPITRLIPITKLIFPNNILFLERPEVIRISSAPDILSDINTVFEKFAATTTEKNTSQRGPARDESLPPIRKKLQDNTSTA
jgi:hypothetical protein